MKRKDEMTNDFIQWNQFVLGSEIYKRSSSILTELEAWF